MDSWDCFTAWWWPWSTSLSTAPFTGRPHFNPQDEDYYGTPSKYINIIIIKLRDSRETGKQELVAWCCKQAPFVARVTIGSTTGRDGWSGEDDLQLISMQNNPFGIYTKGAANWKVMDISRRFYHSNVVRDTRTDYSRKAHHRPSRYTIILLSDQWTILSRPALAAIF